MARLELKLWNSSRRLWSGGAVRLKSRPSTMTFCRLAARLVQMLLRQVWPPAGCAQQAVPPGAPRSIAARARAALARLERCHLQPAEQHPRSTGVAVAFSSASSELWALKRAQRQQLKADFNAAAALPLKLGMHSCKELREAKTVEVRHRADRLSEDDLATFGTLGSLLPALDMLILNIYPRADAHLAPLETVLVGRPRRRRC